MAYLRIPRRSPHVRADVLCPHSSPLVIIVSALVLIAVAAAPCRHAGRSELVHRPLIHKNVSAAAGDRCHRASE
jgi:hypothetical protein